MPGFCVACDKKLTGRQRYYCSEKCRKRYKRLSALYPGLSGMRPASEAFVRDTSAFVRESSGIAVILVIKYNDHGRADSSDGWALKSLFGKEIQKMSLQTLKRLFPGWEFEIKRFDVQKR